MFRYVALIWNASDPARQASASRWARRLTLASSDWNLVLNAPGLQVFCRTGPLKGGSAVYPLAREFYRAAVARGLDVKLGLAAAATQMLLMAPLSALSAVVMFSTHGFTLATFSLLAASQPEWGMGMSVALKKMM